MADVGVKLKVDGEKEFKQAIKDCNAAYKEFGSELKLEQAELAKTGDKQKFLADQHETLGKAIDNQKTKVQTLSDQLEKAKSAYGENSTQVRDLQTQLNGAKTDLAKLEKQEADNTEETKKLTKGFKDNESQSKALSNTWGALKAAGKAIGAAIAAVGAAAVAAGKKIFDMTVQTSETADNIDKMSQKIGISAQAFQEWDYVFKMSGADVNGLQVGMKKLGDVMVDARNGSKQAAEKLQAVGISMEALNNMTEEQALQTVITNLQGMAEGAERTQIASDLLGKSAIDMAAVLNMSADATKALKQEAYDYGMIMSNEAVEAGANFDDSLQRLKDTMSGLKNSMTSELMPSLTMIMDGISGLVAGNDDAVQTISEGVKSIVGVVGTLLPTFLPMISGIIKSICAELIELFPTLLNVVVELFLSIVDLLLSSLPELIPVVLEAVLTITNKLIEELPTIISAAIQIVLAIVSGITQALPELIPAVIDAILTIVQALIDNLPLILKAGLELILALTEGIITALPQLIERLPEIIISIVDFVIESIPQVIEAGTKLLTSLIANLPTIIMAIVEAIPEIVTGIFEAFTNEETLKQIADAGMQLIMGLWEGIKDMGAWLWDQLSGFCDGIVSGICDFFGIHSPSRVFAGIGKNLVLGMEEGFDKESQDMMKDVNGLASDITSAMTINGSVGLAGGKGGKANLGNVINIYPQELNNSTVDYLFQRFNAQMGATV